MVASLFGSHAAEPILASVRVRAQQKAGHMNASNRMTRTDFVNLARRGPSTYGTSSLMRLQGTPSFDT